MERRNGVGFIALGFSLTIVPIVVVLMGGFSSEGKEFDETRRNMLVNDLVLATPVGWNSWNDFNYKIDEKVIEETGGI